MSVSEKEGSNTLNCHTNRNALHHMPTQTFVSVIYCCRQIIPSISIGTRYRYQSRRKVSVSEVSVNCGPGLTLIHGVQNYWNQNMYTLESIPYASLHQDNTPLQVEKMNWQQSAQRLVGHQMLWWCLGDLMSASFRTLSSTAMLCCSASPYLQRTSCSLLPNTRWNSTSKANHIHGHH